MSPTVSYLARLLIRRWRSQALSGLPAPLVSAVGATSQMVLRFFPTLCSELHVVGRKK